MELLVPTVSDIVFKYSWPIKKYMKVVSKKTSCDSPSFNININGIQSEWNLSIRFWKGPQGKRITNPVVLCLNMLNCSVEEVEQARVRFQFGVHNAEIRHWEFCHVNRTILELKTTSDILSLGYRDLCIVDRHVDKSGDVTVMVKIQIIQSESEKHSLSQDMARLLRHPRAADTRLSCAGTNNTEIPVHSGIIAARSPTLASMITPIGEIKDAEDASSPKGSLQNNGSQSSEEMAEGCIYKGDYVSTRKNGHQEVVYVYQMELCDVSEELTQELLRYIYSDHVDNLDALAAQLLSLAERFDLQGLKELCERNLIETITPENVASLLLLADECSCEMLKRAALAYCEENAMNINKNLAWKMMEQVNPELFNEVCEGGIGSSLSSNIDDSELSD